MSASINDAASANSQGTSGQFHSSVPGSEPLTTHGHQPGRINSEADAAPEFHATTLPAGTAPPSRTFKPDNTSEVEGTGATSGQTTTSASETIVGATSGDVHTGLGHPGSGQSSKELHDGSKGRSGPEGVGTSGLASANNVDARDPKFADQRGLGKEEVKGAGKGMLGGAPANEQVNETAH
ncbi:Protein sum2 [Sphaceloma murrayae]|uniref:Protein sum2 n=1 Tax=Sphaceloma murrayae TaxID=2082308 RepID=A0A2K1QJ85_9PEZI|nr:Protein sum2 [Sphaceloma murrayae]